MSSSNGAAGGGGGGRGKKRARQANNNRAASSASSSSSSDTLKKKSNKAPEVKTTTTTTNHTAAKATPTPQEKELRPQKKKLKPTTTATTTNDKKQRRQAEETNPKNTKEEIEEEEEEKVEEVNDEEEPVSSPSSATSSATTFEELGVDEQLCEACRLLGWTKPTQIQCEAIPQALQGRDVIGLAQTGSGKTAAFSLPILQALLNRPQGLFALILAPTRELALQISEQVEALGSTIGVKCATIVGGVDVMDQAIALSKKPHVVCATPGRLVFHLQNTKGFDLKRLKVLVLDEADRLLNMDYEEEINTILQNIPRERNTFLFSATMTNKVEKLQRASLRNPVKVSVSDKYQTVKTLVQNYIFIPEKYKDCYLTFLLNEFTGNSIIVFVATCNAAQRLALLLRNLGFPALPIHGKMDQSKRVGALNTFKAGTRNILIATDVASRGLDIPSVDLIINYDIPLNSKDYIHRVGRTARANRAGRAIAMVTQYDVEYFQRIEKLINLKLDLFPLETEEVLLLEQRVLEAQRFASMELREMGWTAKGQKKGGKGDNDADDLVSHTVVKKRMHRRNNKKK
ncbi:ribosomal RNA processing protein [Balamuthia mandrillaris]